MAPRAGDTPSREPESATSELGVRGERAERGGRGASEMSSGPVSRSEALVAPERRSMRPPRDPILDPWSHEDADEGQHAALGVHEGAREDGVFTSAAPLASTLERPEREDRITPPVPPPQAEEEVPLDDLDGAEEVDVEPASEPPREAAEGPRDAEISDEEAAEDEADEELEPAPPSAPPAPEVLHLEEVETFSDLPAEVLKTLSRTARVEMLEPEEELPIHGVSLMLAGDAAVCARVTETPARIVAKHAVIPARGSLSDGIAMRLVAGPLGASVATWEQDAFDAVLSGCGWALDELSDLSDQLQILAGAALGALGELDVDARDVVMARFGVRAKAPGALVLERGQPVELVVVGAGTLVVEGQDKPLGPGDWLFADALIHRGAAPAAVRAGPAGALLLAAERPVAQELFVSVPPLLDILSR
jgi:hypothetical protein